VCVCVSVHVCVCVCERAHVCVCVCVCLRACEYGRSDAMNALSNIYAEGDTPFADKHLAPLDPIIVEGEGYLYGIRSIQIGKTFSKEYSL